jgi:uncharacterized protein
MALKCPICKKPAAWKENPFRPFCSERCQLIDLGAWASGDYAVPSDEAPPFEELERNPLTSGDSPDHSLDSPD